MNNKSARISTRITTTLTTTTTKDRPKVVISVSAETEITPKVTIHFRPKTETENACDL